MMVYVIARNFVIPEFLLTWDNRDGIIGTDIIINNRDSHLF